MEEQEEKQVKALEELVKSSDEKESNTFKTKINF